MITEKEKEELREINSLALRRSMLVLEKDYKKSAFWFNFQKRVGGGNFQMDLTEIAVYELSDAEVKEENKNHENTKG